MTLMDTGTHNPGTKAGRAKMAEEIRRLAEEYGAEVNYKPGFWDVSHDLMEVKLNGVELFFDIRKKVLPLLHWYVRSGRRLSAKVGVIAEVNPYHRAKATAYLVTWEGVKDHLHMALTLIKSGKAFEDEVKS